MLALPIWYELLFGLSKSGINRLTSTRLFKKFAIAGDVDSKVNTNLKDRYRVVMKVGVFTFDSAKIV